MTRKTARTMTMIARRWPQVIFIHLVEDYCAGNRE
jgi:hypothetical protein